MKMELSWVPKNGFKSFSFDTCGVHSFTIGAS